MEAKTGDCRYEQLLPQLKQQEKEGEITMCELLDRYEKQGMEKGMRKGMEEGMQKGLEKGIEKGIAALVVTCKSLRCTKKEVMGRLHALYEFKSDEAAMAKVDLYWELQ